MGMKNMRINVTDRIAPLIAATLIGFFGGAAQAQTVIPDQDQIQQVIVTGSRIAREGAEAQQPVTIINRDAIDKTNLQSLGELLQQLTTGGSALNTKFNSSGNFGYPPDGGGIGAGSSQVDLRNLDSKRVLVLVDGIRWVNESSASGVSGSADLNTIPLAIVERIEVLEDGASAVYGSDAIAGVVNVITRKKFDGAEITGYIGEYGKGGRTTEGTLMLGGSNDKFSAVFVANYYNQDAISSSKWWQSAFPEPLAGLAAGSSGTPQGRNIFCDPRVAPPAYGSCTPDQGNYYDVTLNNGTKVPAWNPLDPTGGTYHNFVGSQDRFNFAPFNDILTPSERKSIFTNVGYNINDDVRLHAKGLFNNRQSQNQAAPEPIFVGPFAGTGGIADTITVAANNPYNPFGITLDPATNFGFITRRPLEVGPRIFNQDVNTYYLNVGMDGDLHFGNGLKWEVNAAYSDNKAEQTFLNGFNIAKIKLALGDVNVCNAVPGCVPLDLFGGQGRQMTPAMINYIRATQLDSSDEKLALVSANVTGTMFHIQDRAAGFAVGVEHRKYIGEFNPDPLRTTGESQDSPAFPVNASYHVNEAYAEFNLPLLPSFDTSGAVRYSDYSTFGGATTGKLGFRWQPVNDLALRGTFSKGFRAPNLGELFGLTQFGPTVVDPCGPTSGAVVTGPAVTPLQKACVAQGVPVGFVQANTQITSFTGGNAALQPEKSDSYTVGLQYHASWAETGITDKLTAETTYYHHKVTGAIQAEDLQALLNSCIAAGGTDPALCGGFSRGPSGNLNPPKNFLQNFGQITTGGVDLKIDWVGSATPLGRPSVSVQSTYVDSYKAIDDIGNVSTRQVGVEINNGSIPRIRANAQIGWTVSDWQASWIVRYIHSVTEPCSSAAVIGVAGCETSSDFHVLRAVVYNDVQLEWRNAFALSGMKIALGVNNLFGLNPPICFTCTLNGYDAATYDLPGAFWNVRASYKF
jgi:iron complex outermembrane receptor protein